MYQEGDRGSARNFTKGLVYSPMLYKNKEVQSTLDNLQSELRHEGERIVICRSFLLIYHGLLSRNRSLILKALENIKYRHKKPYEFLYTNAYMSLAQLAMLEDDIDEASKILQHLSHVYEYRYEEDYRCTRRKDTEAMMHISNG